MEFKFGPQFKVYQKKKPGFVCKLFYDLLRQQLIMKSDVNGFQNALTL